MSPLTAKEALTYAVSREMVRIYVVVLVGLLLQLVGTTLLVAGLPHPLGDLLHLVFTVVGFVATFVGSVALLYKLVADGTARA
ncbi:hypothetical protein [Natronomonas marina]|uniref:hypothetical protein n=1 Tax=Natronomonas marina TaxID=2961939 RepID=UPI0020C95D9C|nr:hypothetical protein [Natronomonas marina]